MLVGIRCSVRFIPSSVLDFFNKFALLSSDSKISYSGVFIRYFSDSSEIQQVYRVTPSIQIL